MEERPTVNWPVRIGVADTSQLLVLGNGEWHSDNGHNDFFKIAIRRQINGVR
jgi:hypothetical protein